MISVPSGTSTFNFVLFVETLPFETYFFDVNDIVVPVIVVIVVVVGVAIVVAVMLVVAVGDDNDEEEEKDTEVNEGLTTGTFEVLIINAVDLTTLGLFSRAFIRCLTTLSISRPTSSSEPITIL